MHLQFMQPKLPIYKKLFVFGFVLLLVFFPLLILLEIEFVDFFKHLNAIISDEGIVCGMFSTGVGFVFIGMVIRLFSKA